MDIFILLIFTLILIGCIIADISILIALLAGYFLFALYSLKKGFSPKSILQMSIEGVLSAKNILITFMLIGILTALWRASGTIPAIVCYSMRIIRADIFIAITFLLNCLVSFLTGTAFGTAATMGCICMTVAKAIGADPLFVGGAIVSGAFFGDRCSPVSTSALLVSELTGTNLYKNIKNMFKTAVIPFVLALAAYTAAGFLFAKDIGGEIPNVGAMFENVFELSAVTLVPAIVILVFSLAKLNVKITMTASILVSAVICIFIQKLSFLQVLDYSLFGFVTDNTAISSMINGGGIVSMLRVAAIVSISSSYSGIFRKTGILDSVSGLIRRLSDKTYPFVAIVITSIVSGCVACNQTLAIMLTDQLCSHLECDKDRFAIYLENSAVVIAPLIPWSIAGGVPIASSGSPTNSLLAAFYLYFVPMFGLLVHRTVYDAREAKKDIEVRI